MGGDLTVSLNAATAPDGTSHASRAASSGGGHALLQQVRVTPGGTYTFSFFARNNGGAGASDSVYDNTSYAEIVPSTSYFARIGSSSFTRLQVTFTVPAGCSTINVYPVRDSGAADVLLWGARLEAGSVATGYDGVLTDILVLSPSSVQGEASAAGTLSLASPAPAGGAIVPLSSSDPTIAAVPSSVR